MLPDNSIAAQWLEREDEVAHEGRLERLRWIEKQYLAIDIQLFPGGQTSRSLFEEARYCFVYGQFLATVMLGMAFIERSFAADLFAAGHSNLQRASLTILLREELQRGLISQIEFNQLESVRANRNSVAHFRSPGHPETVEFRSVLQAELP